jgi:Abortive infection alpha
VTTDPEGVLPPDGASEGSGGILALGPGLIRVVGTSAWRVLEWSVSSSLDISRQLLKGLASGQAPGWIVDEGIFTVRSIVRQALGLPELQHRRSDAASNGHTGLTSEQLRAKGAELLFQSANVNRDDDLHPAYERILTELSPDEARILRFFYVEGAQPSVDVRTARPLGIGSELVASGLTMIGIQAGVRRVERTKPYLNNLYRLGLVWFSREPLPTPSRYQVLEVQPDVMQALKLAGRTGRTTRRSIELTPFGEDFCRTCFPVDANGSAGPPD